MRRRQFITLLGGAAAWPLVARAQQPAMPLVAVLSPAASQEGLPHNIAEFIRGLRAKGYEDGKTVKLEFRFANWQFDRLPQLAAELVALNPNVLVTHTTNGVNAARAATRDIPIVVCAAGDLLQRGVIKSLARPGGNITGLTLLSLELDAKRIELLKEVLPAIHHVAILVNPANPAWQGRPGDLVPLTKGLVSTESRTPQVMGIRNQLLGGDSFLFSAHRGLIWIAKLRRTVNRGLPRMSRG